MPLKRPEHIPKIPKTRKKKAENAINAIPEAKPDKLEYYCKAYFSYDNILKTQNCVFAIETVAEFISFTYEITLEVLKEKREIFIVLMGLKANTNVAPRIQPARTEVSFEDLIGDYTVYVVKQDGSMNAGVYNFNIYNKEIQLLDSYLPPKENNRKFCEFEVSPEENTFAK